MRSPSAPRTQDPAQDAISYSELSLEFMESAKVLAAQGDSTFQIKRDHFFPFFYLAAHSIELMLKAYLSAMGLTERQLKQIGHDLGDACKVAGAKGLVVSAAFVEYSDWLNRYHPDHLFRYWVSGIPMQVPMPRRLIEIIDPELRSIRTQVDKAVRRLRSGLVPSP